MLVAIHQPNFFPWLGYFDKLARSDVFVVLDHVQIQKTGGNWTNRVKVLVAGKATWLTAPIERAYSGTRRIDEECFVESIPWRRKTMRTLEANYGRAPCFRETISWLEPLIEFRESRLAEYNMNAIRIICASLGLATSKLVRSSTLHAPGQGTDLLVSLVRAVGGSDYLCGGGASGYQTDSAFQRHGIELCYQNFSSPLYPQMNTMKHVPGLSVIDVLMNCGIEKTRLLLGLRAEG